MDNYLIGLITTFILGLFILFGALIALLIKRHDKIIDFSIGLAFGVIITLIITDLIPEIFEGLGFKYLYLFIIFSVLGFGILKILDKFIPDHHEHDNSLEDKNNNLIHIGIMTTVTLVLHNILEGMAVYASCMSDSNLGLMLMIGVGFHNIPLGMVVASSFYHSNKNIHKTVISLGCVSLSTFVGGIIMYLFKFTSINEVLLGILLSITLGMLLFIVIDELIPRIRSNHNKTTYIGITIGVILLLISMIIE